MSEVKISHSKNKKKKKHRSKDEEVSSAFGSNKQPQKDVAYFMIKPQSFTLLVDTSQCPILPKN